MTEHTGTLEESLRFATQASQHNRGYLQQRELTLTDQKPAMQDLETLNERLSRIRNTMILSKSQIDTALKLAERQDILDKLLVQIQSAIRTSTPGIHIFSIYDEIEHLKDKKVDGIAIRDRVSEVVAPPISKHGRESGGQYNPINNQVQYTTPELTAREILEGLAQSGLLPYRGQTYLHEWTHALQFNLGSGKIPPELLEAHAYKAEQIAIVGSRQTINHIVTSGLYYDLDPRKTASASYSIDRLNALGFSQEQIIRIISNPGDWNDKTGFWTNIKQTMQDEMDKRGLSTTYMEKLVMEHHLQRAIALHEARITTQRILQDTFPLQFNTPLYEAIPDTLSFPTGTEAPDFGNPLDHGRRGGHYPQRRAGVYIRRQ